MALGVKTVFIIDGERVPVTGLTSYPSKGNLFTTTEGVKYKVTKIEKILYRYNLVYEFTLDKA